MFYANNTFAQPKKRFLCLLGWSTFPRGARREKPKKCVGFCYRSTQPTKNVQDIRIKPVLSNKYWV